MNTTEELKALIKATGHHPYPFQGHEYCVGCGDGYMRREPWEKCPVRKLAEAALEAHVEPEWEYRVAYREFDIDEDSETLETATARVARIREGKGVYAKTVKVVRRPVPPWWEPIPEESA